MRRLAALALASAALIPGCGGDEDPPPDALSREDSRVLLAARERLDEAIDTEEVLRTSRSEARRLVRAVRRVTEAGGLERGEGGEGFSAAELATVQQAAPSLVRVDRRGRPASLDVAATEAFLARASSDPAGALVLPARRAVRGIARIADDSGAGEATRIRRSGGETVGRLLSKSRRDTRPIWPSLSRRLADARADLD